MPCRSSYQTHPITYTISASLARCTLPHTYTYQNYNLNVNIYKGHIILIQTFWKYVILTDCVFSLIWTKTLLLWSKTFTKCYSELQQVVWIGLVILRWHWRTATSIAVFLGSSPLSPGGFVELQTLRTSNLTSYHLRVVRRNEWKRGVEERPIVELNQEEEVCGWWWWCWGGCKSSFHAAVLKSCWERWQLQESPVPLCSLAVQWVPGRARSDWSGPWQQARGSLLSITPLSEPSRGLDAFTVLEPWERKQKIDRRRQVSLICTRAFFLSGCWYRFKMKSSYK